ncbi:FixH family protein [Tenacibaculum amylolyticum]|uniref:FixH family protein n=1 Tax=Tenacibaculum amylolyticum TaxID=104269 RepID=UPI00389307AA
MKVNWSTGIVIAIIAFIGFILFMVITMTTDKNYNHDLVTDQYYQKELQYQNNIDAIKNAKQLKHPIQIIRSEKGLKINFPKDFNPQEIEGTVFLYRPSNKQLDLEIPISLTNTYMLVPENHLLGGRWNITVAFKYNKTPYLHQEELTY